MTALQEFKEKYAKDADTVHEYADAYLLFNSKARGSKRMDNGIVITKKGKVMSFSDYVMTTKASSKYKVHKI